MKTFCLLKTFHETRKQIDRYKTASPKNVYFSPCGDEKQHIYISIEKSDGKIHLLSYSMFINVKSDLTNRLFVFFTISTEAVKIGVEPIFSTLSSDFFCLESCQFGKRNLPFSPNMCKNWKNTREKT